MFLRKSRKNVTVFNKYKKNVFRFWLQSYPVLGKLIRTKSHWVDWGLRHLSGPKIQPSVQGVQGGIYWLVQFYLVNVHDFKKFKREYMDQSQPVSITAAPKFPCSKVNTLLYFFNR